ncbi:Gfo/Idh/MocA family protein [Kineosporia babensis]|uniref:Gfo/Idh/MocA family oxidoreductase n=1 Tax=Kineosporia babensis TaxID=499548 RepID=A0A9X1SZN7_9ACTN|nr:Gfo/Idh/MocA family oxidoreductase [Kineosporia babensis]MCD5312118.1 Gfo/Idh/MocA family oxidoreductase [Kineosporia babensis]
MSVSPISPNPLGVGFLGAGPVTQAIHLPALAGLGHLFSVRAVMDADGGTARSVAARAGARPSTSVQDVLQDESIDVIAVCSPHPFHAEQVIEACLAGKKVVLCEKPFATTVEDATRIAEVCATTGVPVLVGAMHTHDPGWLAFTQAWGETAGSAQHIRCSAVLPPNPRFEDFATEVSHRPPAPTGPTAAADRIRDGVLGLAIHDLPLIRAFLAEPGQIVVHEARSLTPFGYSIIFSSAGQVVELHALMSENWDPHWSFQVFAPTRAATVTFMPSYVQAGPADVVIDEAGRRTQLKAAPHNGYLGEWQHLYDVAHGGAPRYGTAELVADLAFALDVAEQACGAAATTNRAA